MANEVAIPAWLDFSNYDNYPSEENPTTNAGFINYAKNQNTLTGALVSALLWQPQTNYEVNKVVNSPNIPTGMEAVALTGGQSGTTEPEWDSSTNIYQDSGVKWLLRFKDFIKNGENVGDARARDSNKPTYNL